MSGVPKDSPRAPRVLVVENDRVAGETLAELLRGEGCEVALVATVPAALGWLSKDTADLILADQELDGSTGLGLFTQLVQRRWRGRKILMSGGVTPALQAAVAKLGDVELVAKPLTQNVLGPILAELPALARARAKGRTFKALEEEVINPGLCSLCRGCVSFCTAGTLHALAISGDRPVQLEGVTCAECGVCYLICPQTAELEPDLQQRFGAPSTVGNVEEVFTLRATDPEIRPIASDGGVVTALLHYLVQQGRIDGAVLTQRIGPWANRARLAVSRQDFLDCAGTSFLSSAPVEEVGTVTTYSPIVPELRAVANLDLARLGVVGPSCQLETIRKMQLLHLVPSDVVNLAVGVFCYGSLLLRPEAKARLEAKLGRSLSEVARINMREDLIVKFRDGSEKRLPLDEVDAVTRPECLICEDFANIYGDLSVGGVGSPEGWTSVVARTPQAAELVRKAIRAGLMEQGPSASLLPKVRNMVERKSRRAKRAKATRAG